MRPVHRVNEYYCYYATDIATVILLLLLHLLLCPPYSGLQSSHVPYSYSVNIKKRIMILLDFPGL